MSDSKVSQLPVASLPLTNTDALYIVQGGLSKQVLATTAIPFTPAPSNLTFYVSTAGSDSNTGDISNPFRTIQHGLNIAAQFNYQGLYFPTVNVADGAYGEDVTVPIFINVIGTGYAVLQGNHATPGNVTLNSIAQIGAINFAVDGVQLNAAGTSSPAITCWIVRGGIANPRTINLNPPTNGTGFDIGQAGNLIQAFGNTDTIKWVQTTGGNSFIILSNNSYAQITGMTLAFPVGGVSFFNFIQISSQSSLFWDYLTAVTGGAIGGRPLLSNNPTSILTSHGAATDLPGTGPWVLRTGANIEAVDFGLRGWASDDFQGSYPNGEVPKDCWGFFSDTGAGGFQGSPRGFIYDDGTRQYFLPVVDYVNTQTVNYTVGFSDVETRIETNSAGAITITVDTDTNMNAGSRAVPIGTKFKVTNINTGVTTIAGAGGVTVHNAGTVAQWATAVVYKRGTNEWVQTSV